MDAVSVLKNKMLRIIARLISWAVMLAISFYMLWCLTRIFLYDQSITPTESMVPTLLPGDRIVVDKTIMGARIYTDFNFDKEGIELKSRRTRGRREIRPNDILVFNFPHHGGKINFVINNVYAKRCIGTPGDTITIKEGHFQNNNHTTPLGVTSMQDNLANIPDSIIPSDVMTAMPHDGHVPWTIKDFGPLYIPRKGDRINLSAKEGCIYRIILEWETGKTITTDWERNLTLADGVPLQCHTFSHDYYFMCGDNVSNSRDSRYWGLVPEEYIVGVVSRISYSIDPRTGRHRKDRMLKLP